MQTFYLSSSLILLYEGVYALLVFIVYLIIVQFIPCKSKKNFISEICKTSKWSMMKNDIINCFGYFSIKSLFVWFYIISVYCGSYFRVETIRMLTPTHRFVGEMIFQIYWFVYNVSSKNHETIIWMQFRSYYYCLERFYLMSLLWSNYGI